MKIMNGPRFVFLLVLVIATSAGLVCLAKNSEPSVTTEERAAPPYFLSVEKASYEGRYTLDCRKMSNRDWEYLLQTKSRGILKLSLNNASGDDLARLKGMDNLSSLNLYHSKTIGGVELRHLQALSALQALVLPEGFPDTGLQYLKGLHGLTSLRIHILTFDVTASGLAHLQELDNLEYLEITDSKITDKEVAQLEGLKNLKSLNLDRNRQLTDAGLVYLKVLSNLETLVLPDTMTGAGLKHLVGLKKLKSLSLSGRTTDLGLCYIGKMASLESLLLSGPTITDGGLAHLSGLKKLKVLQLRFASSVSNDGLIHLAPIKSLRELELMGIKITDAGLVHLERLPNLQRLNLYSTGITNAAVKSLKKIETLQYLDPLSTGFNHEGYLELERALPNLIIAIDAPP